MRSRMYSTCQLGDGFHVISIDFGGRIEGVFTDAFRTETEAREFAVKYFPQD